jgi:multidrug efflux pump subunit AcrB
MRELSQQMLGRYPGVKLAIEKDQVGPPAGDPISLEVTGDDFEELLSLADSLVHLIEESGIQGIEGLSLDLEVGKPEMLIRLDRDKVRRYGLSTLQVANTLRTALFGREVSDFKVGEEEYPINMRLKEEYRYNSTSLLNLAIPYVENGQTIQVPLSALADVEYRSTYGSVNRKDLKRVVGISSNVIEGYNATRINAQLGELLQGTEFPEGYAFNFAGDQQEQM